MKLGLKLKKSQVLILIGVLVSVVVLFLVAYKLIPSVLVSFTKAAPATKVSLSDSYVIGEKILCKADGVDGCVVNVFLLDKNGKPVVGKTADLVGVDDIEKLNSLTDTDGKVAFEVRSETERQYNLSASHQNVPLGSVVTVTFRN